MYNVSSDIVEYNIMTTTLIINIVFFFLNAIYHHRYDVNIKLVSKDFAEENTRAMVMHFTQYYYNACFT